MHRHTLKALFFLKAVEPNDKKDDWRKKQPWTPMDDGVLDRVDPRKIGSELIRRIDGGQRASTLVKSPCTPKSRYAARF